MAEKGVHAPGFAPATVRQSPRTLISGAGGNRSLDSIDGLRLFMNFLGVYINHKNLRRIDNGTRH